MTGAAAHLDRMQLVASLAGVSLQHPSVLLSPLSAASFPCIEGDRHGRGHVCVDASPCSGDGRRAHRQANQRSQPEGQNTLEQAGHPATTMRNTQEHKISVVSALTWFDIIVIAATDLVQAHRAAVEVRRRQLQQQRWRDQLWRGRQRSLGAPCGCGPHSTSVLHATGRRRKAQWRRTRFRRFNPTKQAGCISTTNYMTSISRGYSSLSTQDMVSSVLVYLMCPGQYVSFHEGFSSEKCASS